MKTEQYILVNKKDGVALSIIDKNYNSRMLVGQSSELVKIIESDESLKENYDIMSVSDYFTLMKEVMNSKEYIEDKSKISEEILEMLRNMLPDNQKQKIQYDFEKRNRNVTGFPSIVKCNNNDDIKVSLWERLDAYERFFQDKMAFNYDSQLLNEIQKSSRCIKSAWDWYQKENIEKATEQIEEMLKEYIDDDFFVAELEKTYGVKQISYYNELQYKSCDYSVMKQHPITLYRGRSSGKRLIQRKDMLHRPYIDNEKISRQRFTCEGMPALYLSTTSYGCWLELNKPEKDFYVSTFVPDECGKKLRILNLVVTEDLINGVYRTGDGNMRGKELQEKMISFWPLVLATSYKNVDSNDDKTEYIMPELVMRSLKKFNIDGIAYVSKHLEHDLQFQLGVNIVIPVYKEHLDQGYGLVSKYFKISKPKRYSAQEKETYAHYKDGSYIYDIYYKLNDSYRPTVNSEEGNKEYGDTLFAKFDNYLANQKLAYYNE